MALENPYIFERLRRRLLQLYPECAAPAATFEGALDRVWNEWTLRGGRLIIDTGPGHAACFAYIGLQEFGHGRARTWKEAVAEALLMALEPAVSNAEPPPITPSP
jgi:hypothetical protein